MAALRLLKYEGLGNDFLVLVDRDREFAYDATFSRAICDRHHGIGADGLLRLSDPRHGGDLLMELRNADGSIAETSGNGMRCAVLAAIDEGLVHGDELEVETVAGKSRASVELIGDLGIATIRVDMGLATIERLPEFDLGARLAYGVNIGNPHLALVSATPDGLEVGAIGPDLESATPGGQNVEIVTVDPDRGQISIDTWERGSGLTLACGSGSCAAAAAARLAGLVDSRVTVHNRGGDVVVELDGSKSAPRVMLIGDTRRIGVVVFDDRDLAAFYRYMRISA